MIKDKSKHTHKDKDKYKDNDLEIFGDFVTLVIRDT